MEIPFFRYSHVFGQQRDEIHAAIIDVMDRGAFILQAEVREFEAQIARLTGARHAIGTANATDALELVVKAAGIGPSDEVILPSHSFIATAAAVRNNNATPVLADCGDDHLIDPDSIEALITPQTKAIMPVQLNGRVANMDRISALAAKHKLILLEDSSQALGAKFKAKCAGTFGLAGVFSFYPAKVLGCFGDGGIIITSDDTLAEKLRLMRDHGRGGHGGLVELWGRNSRLDNLQATIMLVKLRAYAGEISRRRELAALYTRGLKDISELSLPPAPSANSDHFDIFQNYEIQADRRDELRVHLETKGVKTIVQWGGKAIHQFPALGFKSHLPRTDRLFTRCCLLPMNSSLTDAEVDYVCAEIRSFYRR